MWLQGSLLAPVTISSRQMMQTLSIACRSSGVASGYLGAQWHVNRRPQQEIGGLSGRDTHIHTGTHSVFMLRMARRDMMASVTAFLNCLEGRWQ